VAQAGTGALTHVSKEERMKRWTIALFTIATIALCLVALRAQQVTPAPAQPIPPELLWAWGYGASVSGPAAVAVAAADPVRIPGSRQSLPRALFRRAKGDEGVKEVPDWAPDAHPPMPPIVKLGRSIKDANGQYLSATDPSGKVVNANGGVEDGGIRACGFCHSAHGMGNPGNSALAGLTAGYMRQQLEDFARGLRMSSDPKKGNVMRMAWFASQMTASEITDAVDYFAALPFANAVRVVESDTAPKTRMNEYFEPAEGALAGVEPLGGRIVEVAEHPELSSVRAPNAPFVAYVPAGSVAAGEQLTAKLQCRLCHGADLGGLDMGAVGGDVPAIAGRSPSYMARQLFDFKTGARQGRYSALMKTVVAQMTPAEMVKVVAYVASQPAPRGRATPESPAGAR
jgi:cytochrome c553